MSNQTYEDAYIGQLVRRFLAERGTALATCISDNDNPPQWIQIEHENLESLVGELEDILSDEEAGGA